MIWWISTVNSGSLMKCFHVAFSTKFISFVQHFVYYFIFIYFLRFQEHLFSISTVWCMLRSGCSAAVATAVQCVRAFGIIFIWALGHSVTRTQVSYFSSSEEGQAGMSESALSACCAPSYWLDLDTSTLTG